jgi:acyl-lipid omega-3 desaturase
MYVSVRDLLQEVDLSQAPPFTLADLKNAIPAHCFKRKPGRSMAYLIRDVAIVVGMAVAAYSVNAWWAPGHRCQCV